MDNFEFVRVSDGLNLMITFDCEVSLDVSLFYDYFLHLFQHAFGGWVGTEREAKSSSRSSKNVRDNSSARSVR